MKYFSFERLIEKYKVDFKLILPGSGHYDDAGDWVEQDDIEKELSGAIISFKENKIFRSEGTISTNDKRLFTLEPLGEILDGLSVIYNGKNYKVEESTDNSNFTGVYAYILRYVSVFKEGNK